jgi:hypothetical protein
VQFWYRRLLMRECDVLKAVESSNTQQNQQPTAPFGFGVDGNPMMAYGMNSGWGMQGVNPYHQQHAAGNGQSGGGPGGAGTSHWQKMMNLLMQLRKVCNHPYLFNIDAEPDFDGQTTGEDIVEVSGKMTVLDKLLNKLKVRAWCVAIIVICMFARCCVCERYQAGFRQYGCQYLASMQLQGLGMCVRALLPAQESVKCVLATTMLCT